MDLPYRHVTHLVMRRVCSFVHTLSLIMLLAFMDDILLMSEVFAVGILIKFYSRLRDLDIKT